MAALSQVSRGEWVPDSERSHCVACSKSFGLFVRRHHCRYCGDIFCNRCCPRTRLGVDSARRSCPACRQRGLDVQRRRETTATLPIPSSEPRVDMRRHLSTTERPRATPQAEAPIRRSGEAAVVTGALPGTQDAQQQWTCLACSTSNLWGIRLCGGCSLPPSVSHSISNCETLKTTARLRAQTTLGSNSSLYYPALSSSPSPSPSSTSSSSIAPSLSTSTSSASLGSTMQIKCHLNDDKRIFRLDYPLKYSALIARVEESFGQSLKIAYRDAEGDLITISSQADLEDLAANHATRIELFLSPKNSVAPPSSPPLCSICFEQQPNAIFLPCAHLGACLSCSALLRQCPFCRQTIERVQQVFAV